MAFTAFSIAASRSSSLMLVSFAVSGLQLLGVMGSSVLFVANASVFAVKAISNNVKIMLLLDVGRRTILFVFICGYGRNR